MSRTTLTSNGRRYRVADLRPALGPAFDRLPVVLRILLENGVRHGADGGAALAAVLRDWLEQRTSDAEIEFYPARILMHDTTCVPALVDIAAMRSAIAERGGDPEWLNPVLPVDVSVDHSVAVDHFASPDALALNMRKEIERNAERYRLMKWASGALAGLKVHPPGTGIMHTMNLERLATVVTAAPRDGETWAFPDTLIGTDSHTPMINGLGVLAWGVGGLEAESVLFGMPVALRLPDVIGVRLSGALRAGMTATDLALTVTERLRRLDLAGRFVEFFGPGVASLPVGHRAAAANMAPEYGASTGYFAIDAQTIRYLRDTGRDADRVALVEAYARHQGLWSDPGAAPVYTEVIEIALDRVEPSIAGPRRPQDRLAPSGIAAALKLTPAARPRSPTAIPAGAVAIAAITSCTNTSDPRPLIAAGLVARKARARGLVPPPWVKTSLAPGSPATAAYLERAGLLDDLAAVGFAIVGYGCTTCIGNSGPLAPAIAEAVARAEVEPVAILSGNRNFPGRVHAQVDSAFLASPPLVVAYALAGDAQRDILSDPVATARDGSPVRLAELWPADAEIDALLAAVRPGDFPAAYDAAGRSRDWDALEAPAGALFPWDDASTYIRRPPFAAADGAPRLGRYAAHPLLVLGDDVTTDHISPAGSIDPRGDAARYLVAHGENPADLNVFAARRGNWEAMRRGLFTNRTVRNRLVPDAPPGATIHFPSGEILPVWQAAERYMRDGAPLVVVAGERYGAGSSRDWAAKGLALLGVRAVLARSFERIHRSNLVGMGILPLYLPAELGPQDFVLGPGERVVIDASADPLPPRAAITVTIARANGTTTAFTARAGVETALEAALLARGGIIPYVLDRTETAHRVKAG